MSERTWQTDPSTTGCRPVNDILDLAVFWVPIGGPTADKIWKTYRQRLLDVIGRHHRADAQRMSSNHERVDASSVLAALDEGARIGITACEFDTAAL